MIRPLEMIRSLLKGQRGGVATAVATGFLAFSIPLISGSLNLASAVNIDARVKADNMHQDYCGLAVKEYINYLLMDTTRWDTFLADNQDPYFPGKVTATIDLCGEDITLNVSQDPPNLDDDPLDEEPPSIPFLGGAYNQRKFQTFKTVSNPYSLGGEPVTYTITVINRDTDPTSLTEIHDTLPAGFTYDCSATPAQLTLPGLAPQDIVPYGGVCPAGSAIQWDMPASTSIQPNDVVTLVFDVITFPVPGTYCNEVYVIPGSNHTRSGQTAIVEVVEPLAGVCPGKAVLFSQTMDYVNLISSDLSTIPFTYTMEIGYTITVENIGSEDLELSGFVDLLPTGSLYSMTIPTGDITDAPFNLFYSNSIERERVTWKFDPTISLASGTTQTLSFSTTAVSGRGNYWVDLLVDFEEGTFDEKLYTWPTAVIAIKDVYNVTATDADGNEYFVDLQVLVQGEDGLIASWNVN